MNPQTNDGAVLSAHIREEIDAAVKKYPADRKRSVVFAALHAVQHEHGYLAPEMIDAVADYLGLESIKVQEVATFYSMYETKPVEIGRASCRERV